MTSITLRGPGEIVAALPYQFGFHPTDAVVVVAFHGRALGVLQRIDLPPRRDCAQAARALLPALCEDKPDAVLLVGFESSEGRSQPMLDELERLYASVGLDVTDTLVVRDGRWYAPRCGQSCCPPEGTPVPAAADTPAVAEYVGMGMAPLRGRDALVEQLAANTALQGAVAKAVAASDPSAHGETLPLDSVDQEAPSQPVADREHCVRREREDALAVWAMVFDVGASRPPVEGLSPAELAAAARSLQDHEVRDALIAWVSPGSLPLALLEPGLAAMMARVLPDPVWSQPDGTHGPVVAGQRLQQRLAFLCRAFPDAHAPAVLTLLANFTWWRGDGAMSRTALERALDLDPDYRLARLLLQMVDLAVRPRAIA